MFILVILVNWRFFNQRMKLYVSSIRVSKRLLLIASMYKIFLEAINIRLLLFIATRVTYRCA